MRVDSVAKSFSWAGVRVAHEADGEVVEVALLDLAPAPSLDLHELAPQLTEAALGETTIDLELLLAGAAGSDPDRRPADDLPQVIPHRPQPGIGVLELGDLDLEPGRGGRRPAREDVEDQLAAIDDLALDGELQRADLGRCQLVVEDHEGRAGHLREVGELLDLSLAEIGLARRLATLLHELADDRGAGRLREGPKLAEGIGFVDGDAGKPDVHEHRRLRRDLQLFTDCRGHARVGVNRTMIRRARGRARSGVYLS